MNLAARLAPLFALLAAPFCTPSQAADYEVAPSLVCDTPEQVERFVALFAGDAQAAIRVVNAEQNNPTACAMLNIAFMRGNRLGTARHGDNAFQITHIFRVRRQGIRDLILSLAISVGTTSVKIVGTPIPSTT
jgi:hypothetical protein